MQKLLIAIRSDEFANALMQALSSCFEVHRCSAGADTRRLVNTLRPDVLVLDLRLADSDGLSVLRSCQYKPPVILALTTFVGREIQQIASDAGIHALAMMPCSARYIAEALKEMASKIPSPER